MARVENKQENHIQTIFIYTLCDPNQIPKRSQKAQQLTEQLRSTYMNVPNQFVCESENHLLNLIDAENGDTGYFKNKALISETIIKARNNSSSRGFMNQEHKVVKPMSQRDERFKRVWMVSKGYELYDDLYANVGDGHQFMKNDWGMGPFYSYNSNAKKLESQQIKIKSFQNI